MKTCPKPMAARPRPRKPAESKAARAQPGPRPRSTFLHWPKRPPQPQPPPATAIAPSDDASPAPPELEPAPVLERDRSSYDGDTAIKLYLREIGQVKLLTPDEEIELAARIKRGAKKAREHMIKANLRLVVKIARD